MKLTKLIAYMAIVAVSVTCGVLTMMYGWGLQPRNWWWIIGMGVFGTTILRAIYDKINKEN